MLSKWTLCASSAVAILMQTCPAEAVAQHYDVAAGEAASALSLLAHQSGYHLGTSIYRWSNVFWDDSLLPNDGSVRCGNRGFSGYPIT